MSRPAVTRLLLPALAVSIAGLFPAVQADQSVAPLAVGDSFPVLELEDQFEKERPVPGEAGLIVFSGSKQADDELSGTLGEVAGEALRAGTTIYLSDISRMPGLITRLIAMPALKDRDYPVTLIREEGQADALPAREGCYTLFDLSDDGVVEGIEETCEPEALEAALAPATADEAG